MHLPGSLERQRNRIDTELHAQNYMFKALYPNSYQYYFGAGGIGPSPELTRPNYMSLTKNWEDVFWVDSSITAIAVIAPQNGQTEYGENFIPWSNVRGIIVQRRDIKSIKSQYEEYLRNSKESPTISWKDFRAKLLPVSKITDKSGVAKKILRVLHS